MEASMMSVSQGDQRRNRRVSFSGLGRPAGASRGSGATTIAEATDNDLMEEIQAGSHDAFARLYGRYSDRAYRVARAVSADDGRAEESVQEGFLSVWRSRDTYRPDGTSAGPWLLTVVRHRAIDVGRRNATHRAQPVDEEVLERRPSAEDVAGDAADRANARDIRVLLNRLPDAQREVIVLAFYGQLTHSEIAGQLGVPVGTVKGRMRLGLHKLREELDQTPV
jgi:RNA polymerase sigma-70 factor (ECF subfamily)